MDWTHNTFFNDELPNGDAIFVDFSKAASQRAIPSEGRYFDAWGYKSKSRNLECLPAPTRACYIELNRSNIHSFAGLSKFSELKRLELHYCLKLESDVGLSGVSHSLEWLHINTSRKFSFGDELLGLRNVKVLCLNACAPVASLQFLSLFPKLLDFRFVDTNIVDGDLTPLLTHPTLCSVGFLNKRHYNLRDREVKEHFSQRKKLATETVATLRGTTFRYVDLRP